LGIGQDGVMKKYKTDAAHPFEWYLNKSTYSFLTYEGSDTQLKLVLEDEDLVGKDIFSGYSYLGRNQNQGHV
jgi:hypothetical protein